MKLLKRYLGQVGRYLPKNDKEDTLKELESLLLENIDLKMEQGMNKEDSEFEAIKEFGNPRTVALKYKDETPILSREIEPLVLLILKIVSVTLPGAIFLATIIAYFTNNDQTTTMGLFLELAYSIPNILTTLLTTLAFIYLIFIFIDRKLPLKFKLDEYQFDPSYLPLIPTDSFKVSRFEGIFNIIGGVLFLYLFNYQPGLIAIYYDDVREPLLNSNFEQILPFLNISVFISIGYNIAFTVKGARTKISATVEFFSKILSSIIMIWLATGDIFNDIIIDGYELEIIPQMFKIAMYIGAIVSGLAAIAKYIKIVISTPEED